MICPKCKSESGKIIGYGRYPSGVKKLYCNDCNKQFHDPTEYQEWSRNHRKRATNKPSNKNAYDEYMIFVILKTFEWKDELKKNGKHIIKLNKISGIGSHQSIAALLGIPKSTVSYWIKKYIDNKDLKPKIKMSGKKFVDYINIKNNVRGLIPLFSLQLKYGLSPEIDEFKRIQERIIYVNESMEQMERVQEPAEQAKKRHFEPPPKIEYELHPDEYAGNRMKAILLKQKYWKRRKY